MNRFPDGGWTVVRYGKESGRSRQPDFNRPLNWRGPFQGAWNRDRGAPFYGKDRAFSSSRYGGRGNQFPYPNQPVPRMGGGQRVWFQNPQREKIVPQKRSYAEVVRQNLPPTGKGFTFQFRPGRWGQQQYDNRQRAADPAFGKCVRKLHTVIKMVHHLQNVTPKPGKSEPVMIARMVENLAMVIKPASPTPETSDLIMGNAKNWGYTTLVILEDHYKRELDKILEDLAQTLPQDWKEAFQVATRWAQRNLARIQKDEIDHAEALITSCKEPDQQQGAQQQQTVPQQQTEPQQQTVPQQQRVTQQQTVTQQQPPLQGQQKRDRTSQKKNAPPGKSREAEKEMDYEEEFPDLSVYLDSETSSPVLKRRKKSRYAPQTRIRSRRVIEGSSDTDSAPYSDSSDDESLPLRQASPKPQRKLRTFQMNRCVIAEKSGLLDIEGSGQSQIQQKETQKERRMPTQEPEESRGATLAQVHAQMTPNTNLPTNNSEDLFDPSFEDTSTPKESRSRVNKHVITQRKMVEWGLSVNKKWLIIGDSNLSKFPVFSIADLQVESYPGANFRHAQEVLSKATVHTTVEKVVLAFGINSRRQKPKETTVKQLQGAVRTAKRSFPYAEIWVPLINYSSSLPVAERHNLQKLNAHIQRNMPFLPLLDEELFQTDEDEVHWTRQTAKEILKNWATALNLTTP